MKKKVFAVLAAALVLPFVLGSCGMGLEPAKADSTSVTFSFASLPGAEAVSSTGRAIIPNGGYLYVRMVNSSATPGYYGPYKLTGSPTAKISITDIPAGSYSAMYLLYSSKEIHKEIVTDKGKTLTFGELFGSLVDNPSENEGGESNGGDDDDIDLLFDGKASFGFYNKPQIQEGTTNSFPITMTPLTHYRIEPDDGSWTLTNALYGETGSSFNGFVRLSSLSALFSGFPSESLQVVFKIWNWGQTLTLYRIDSYDEKGSFINKGLNQSVTLASGTAFDFIVPYKGGDEMFIYLDVSGGNPTLEIEPVLSDVYGKEFTLLTGTLSLGEHNSYFDTVNSLIFSVEVPTGDEAPENSSEGIGFATIEGNPISGYLTVNGFVPNSLIDKNVHLLIIGEKYGANVMYVVDNTVTMVEGINIDLSNDTFTPLLQYAVLYSGYEGQGFANFNGSTGTLEIIIEDEPIPMGSGAINEVDLGVPPYYAAIIPIFSLTSDTYSFAFTGGWGRAETQLNVYEATTFIMVEFQ